MAGIARLRNSSRLGALSASARTRWLALSVRERRMVSLAALLVAATVLWLLLLRPALRVQAQAPQQIEALRATLARAQAQADELGRLGALPTVHAQTSDPGDAVRKWMQAHGAQAQVAALPGSISVKLQRLPAWALADLARTARTQWAARVTTAKLRLDRDGTLSGNLELQASTSPGASTAPDAEQASGDASAAPAEGSNP